MDDRKTMAIVDSEGIITILLW